MQYGFYFDNSRCSGCKTCEMACKDYKDLEAERTFRRVIDYEGGSWSENADGSLATDAYVYHISLACNHCNNAACIHVCPTGAMHKDDLGLVWPDWGKCIGCGYCTMACPYHAPIIDQAAKKSSKCDGCRDRIQNGLKAVCVESCPLRALDFGDVSQIKTAHPDAVSSIPPLADPSYTSPNLFIKPSPAVKRTGEVKGHIANREEIYYPGGDA